MMTGYRFKAGRLGNCAELRADFPGTITKDGSNLVSTWADCSGNGYNAEQPSGTLQPVYMPTGINGKPSIYFEGSKQLSIGNKVPFGTDGHTVYIVGKHGSANEIFISKFISGTNGCFYVGYLVDVGLRYSVVDSASNRVDVSVIDAPTDTYQVLAARYNSTSADLFINGELKGSEATSGNPLKTTTQALVVGNIPAQAWYLNGDIAHIIIVFSPHTDLQIATMTNYLKGNWGLS